MEICGIIAEYNPFHNGHRYQLRAVQERLGSNVGIVVVMSGDFTQRGEPAILDKWTRAAIAVNEGADVVIELPFGFAAASAERFGAGGIALLRSTGVVRHLAFGSEESRLAALESLADLLAVESAEFKQALKSARADGSGFAAARQAAVTALYGEHLAALLSQPNAILGLSYLIALRRQQAALTPLLIARQGPGEHDGGQENGYASASLIRREVLDNSRHPEALLKLSPLLPDSSLAALIRAALSDRLGSPDRFFPTILTLLRTTELNEIAQIASMAPDLHRRLASLAEERFGPGDAEQFVSRAATRAYPASRVRRALLHLLLNYREETERHETKPSAIRVLAFGKKRGRYILKLMRRHAALPIISRTSDILEQEDQVRAALETDLAASDLYALSTGRAFRADFDAQTLPL